MVWEDGGSNPASYPIGDVLSEPLRALQPFRFTDPPSMRMWGGFQTRPWIRATVLRKTEGDRQKAKKRQGSKTEWRQISVQKANRPQLWRNPELLRAGCQDIACQPRR